MKRRRRNPDSVINVRTDGKWKHFIYGYDMSPRVLKNKFDYLDDPESHDGFFKYKGQWYHLSEFSRFDDPNNPLKKKGYDGYLSFTYSSGVAIKVSGDGERYKIAYFWVSSGS